MNPATEKLTKKERRRIYYEKNKERFKEYSRQYYRKNREKKLEYSRLYRLKNKEKVLRENREYYRNKMRKYYHKVREEVLNILGRTCVLCGGNPVVFHEIHYKPHKKAWAGLLYVRKHVEDFVPLCPHCHSLVHEVYNRFGITLDELIRRNKIQLRNLQDS